MAPTSHPGHVAGRYLAAVLPTALLLLAMALHGPARAAPADDLPVLGDTSSAIVSRQMEEQMGADFLRQIRAQLPTRGDPLLQYWTEHLLFDLAASSDLRQPDLDIVLIESAALNAFAAPGGIVGINYGTFIQAPSVHEFAAIMAHELAHLSQRHFARGIEAQRQATLPFLAALLASAALMATVGSDAGMAAMTGTQAVAQQSQLRYSRSREREADRLGIETLARAGYDPWAMAGMFERMQDVHRYSSRPPEFLLTHPVTQSRVADARGQASEFPRRAFEDSLDFQLMQARARVRLTETPQEAVSYFRAKLEEGRTTLPAAARYGLTLALLELGRADRAAETLAPLLEEEPRRIAYVLADVEVALARGNHRHAIERLEQALDVTPENLPLSVAYARALRAGGRHDEAQEILERLATERPNDATIWYDLAETAGLAGDIITVHRARAEYFQLNGNLQNALRHLDYALRLVENDYPMTARLNQRMQDIREMRQRLAG